MRQFLWCVVIVMLAGCEASPLDEAWAPPRSLAGSTASYRPPREPQIDAPASAAQTAAPDPTGELTLADAWKLALLRHPALKMDAWEVRAAEARTIQEGMSPNPELDLRLDDFGGRRDRRGMEKAEVRVRVTQVIELGEKRIKRIHVAQTERALAAWDYEARRVAVAAQVSQFFAATLAAQEEVALRTEGLAFVEAMHKVVLDRVDAGAAPPAEKDFSLARVGMAKIALSDAQLNLDAARRLLAGTWDQDRPTFTRAAGTIPEPPAAAPSVDAMIALLSDHPLVARWAGEIAHRQADIELAKAQAIPDVSVGAGMKYFREDDGQAFLVELGIPLPLFDDNRGEILEKRFALSKAHAEALAARNEARTELIENYLDLAKAFQKAKLLRDDVIPRLQSAHELTKTNFKQGLAKLDDMLDADRDLLRARAERLEALAEYHKAAAILEGLIGRPIDGAHGK